MSNIQQYRNRAQHAIDAYFELGGNDERPDRYTIVDLLADLMHWCDDDPAFDFDDILQSARTHYEEELVEAKAA